MNNMYVLYTYIEGQPLHPQDHLEQLHPSTLSRTKHVWYCGHGES